MNFTKVSASPIDKLGAWYLALQCDTFSVEFVCQSYKFHLYHDFDGCECTKEIGMNVSSRLHKQAHVAIYKDAVVIEFYDGIGVQIFPAEMTLSGLKTS